MEAPKADKWRWAHKYHQFGASHFHNYIVQPGLDIGFAGGKGNGEPMWGFHGLDLGEPDYDGIHLPFPDRRFNTVHTSHVLEHIPTDQVTTVLREWFRVISTGGHLIITVPHADLYERKVKPPSKWNEDHKRFYTPSRLLLEIEIALAPNTWRLIYCRDNDADYDYDIPRDQHPCGSYEIEAVIQRIPEPDWEIER